MAEKTIVHYEINISTGIIKNICFPQADPTKGQVHFAMFPRFDLDGIIKYLKENADVTVSKLNILTLFH